MVKKKSEVENGRTIGGRTSLFSLSCNARESLNGKRFRLDGQKGAGAGREAQLSVGGNKKQNLPCASL